MDNETLYKSISREDIARVLIDYYIIEESISADYCDLKCYGIKIQKTARYDGGGKIIDISQINNVFYRYDDVTEFLDKITEKETEPDELRHEVEKYILESIDRAKKSA